MSWLEKGFAFSVFIIGPVVVVILAAVLIPAHKESCRSHGWEATGVGRGIYNVCVDRAGIFHAMPD